MGGSSSETQQTAQTQQNTTDPAEKALLMGNYSTAQANASKLNTSYGGLLTAGFNPTQTQAQGLFSNIASDPSYMNTANAATSAIGGVLGSPLSGNITAQTYNPAQVAGADLTAYQNPYQSSVIDATMSQINQQRAQAMNGDTQSAIAANAFGNNRLGVQNALTGQLYDQDTATTLAGLNSANFAQAQAAATNDVNAKNAASQFNATQGQNAQQESFNNNETAQQGILGAASALEGANNNALSTATNQAGLLGSVGDVQQQQQQTELTNAYNNWLAGQQMTVTQQQLLNSALGLMPNEGTVTTTGSGTADKSTTPGLTDILGGVGSAGMGLGEMGLTFADVPPKVLRFDRNARRWESFQYVPDAPEFAEAA